MKTHYLNQRASALVAVLLLASSSAFNAARAAVPTDPPVFTNPLTISNAFAPFQPGAIKVFAGSDHGSKATSIDLFLTETRSFTVNNATVECAVLREINFVGGLLVEITDNYFAQADDGTVYYFGEVVNNYENGVIVDHGGSWLVGGPTRPSDPPETANAPKPALFMPANPEVGDTYKPEDLFPIVDETDEVLSTGRSLAVTSGLYTNVIKVKESTQLNSDIEFKWYAPGVGVIQARTEGELLRLRASTLVQP